MKNKAVILLVIFFAAIALVLFLVKPAHKTEIAAIGSSVQNFDLVDINKNTIKVSDLKGSVVLVNFWATWCQSCVDEIPSIENLFRRLSGDSHFKIVTILYKDDLQRALLYMRQNGYTFPVFLNPDESAGRIFGITGVPETFILDKKGILREKVIGPAEWDSPQVVEMLQAFINEP